MPKLITYGVSYVLDSKSHHGHGLLRDDAPSNTSQGVFTDSVCVHLPSPLAVGVPGNETVCSVVLVCKYLNA